MRRTQIITTALVATAALALAPPGGASAKSKKSTKLSCTLDLFAQGVPNPSGIQFGFANCPRPFGSGLHYNAYTMTLPGPGGPGTVVGTFKNYYNRGTASGTFAMTFPAPVAGVFTYKGTVNYTRGTGRFKHVDGNGTIECTSSDMGAHKSCKVNSTLKGI